MYIIIDGPGARTESAGSIQTLRGFLTLAQRVKLEELSVNSALARVLIAELDTPVTSERLFALTELGVIEGQGE